jgi:hypothetical protein
MLTPGATYNTPIELRRLEAEPLTKNVHDEAFVYDPPKAGFRRKGSTKAPFSGWRGRVFASLIVTTVVLSLNIILATVATTA